jgi:hypothetical protein
VRAPTISLRKMATASPWFLGANRTQLALWMPPAYCLLMRIPEYSPRDAAGATERQSD